MNLQNLIAELNKYIESIDVGNDGEHLWDNYQEIVAISMRLQQIHTDIAIEEIYNEASPELRKFRTLVLDPLIERLDKIAVFESRKMTGKMKEFEMDREKSEVNGKRYN